MSEHVCSMSDVPASIRCGGQHAATAVMSMDRMPSEGIGAPVPGVDAYACNATAERVFYSPAAIHFKGPGFYSTEVKGRVERRRRPNVADDLPRGDGDTHRIARHL